MSVQLKSGIPDDSELVKRTVFNVLRGNVFRTDYVGYVKWKFLNYLPLLCFDRDVVVQGWTW